MPHAERKHHTATGAGLYTANAPEFSALAAPTRNNYVSIGNDGDDERAAPPPLRHSRTIWRKNKVLAPTPDRGSCFHQIIYSPGGTVRKSVVQIVSAFSPWQCSCTLASCNNNAALVGKVWHQWVGFRLDCVDDSVVKCSHVHATCMCAGAVGVHQGF